MLSQSLIGSQRDCHDRALEIKSPSLSIPKSLNEVKISIQEEKISEFSFYYLQMDDSEFSAFRKTLPLQFQSISKIDAEQLLIKNKCQFKLNYALDFAANLTNALFPVWLVKTGSSGFILTISLLSGIPQDVLSENSKLEEVANVIVWSTSLLATAQWICMYSPWTEATKSTLRKSTQEIQSWVQCATETFQNLFHHPGENVIKLFSFLALQCITKLVNTTSASTEIFFSPAGITWLPAILIIGLAAHYCSQIWDNSVVEGVKFWLDQKNHTSLVSQIKKGHIAIAIKTFFEGTTASALKALQYYFIAEGNQKLFGWWPPPFLILTAGIFHGLFVNYPSAFKNALGHLEKMDSLLNEKIGPKLDLFFEDKIGMASHSNLKQLVQDIKKELIAIDINFSEHPSHHLDLKLEQALNSLIDDKSDPLNNLHFKNKIFQYNFDLIQEKVLRKGRLKLLTQDPLNAFTLALNTIFGGYAGYRLLTPLLAEIMPDTVGISLATTLGAASLGSFYYRAVIGAEIKKEICEEIKPENRKQNSRGISSTAFILAASGAISAGLSAIGSAGSAVRHSTAGVASVVFASTQKILNDTRYNQPYILPTLQSLFSSVSRCFKKKKTPQETRNVNCKI